MYVLSFCRTLVYEVIFVFELKFGCFEGGNRVKKV